jgi:hypothetical protein
MKTLLDNTLVSARSYYYLLDWNEVDGRKTINKEFNKNRLCDLNMSEYTKLFLIATTSELNNGMRYKEV